MLLAANNTGESIWASTGGDQQYPSDLLDYTFDTTQQSNQEDLIWQLEITTSDGSETYFGIAGHNLAEIGATFTITNRGVIEVSNYAPTDGRPLMFKIEPRGAVGTIDIKITKQNAADLAIISHLAVGHSTDLTSTTTSGQEIERDYQSGTSLAAMHVARKSRVTMNSMAAPVGMLTRTTSTPVSLKIDDVARGFAQTDLLQYQKFWLNNAFFIQFDDDPTQSIMVMDFKANPPTAHSSTRELVNLSYSFNAYNGQ